MKSAFYAVFIGLGLINVSVQRSTPEDSHYVAAVMEYHPDKDVTVNLQNYIAYIRQAAEQDADIVVFPEMTLIRSSSVVVPIRGLLLEYPVPALHPDLYDDVLVQLSAAARDAALYVVVNVQEEMDCSSSPAPAGENCPAAELYRFNTNVVFDRNGSVIDRYRKINLYGEVSRSPALSDDLGVFTTDFGVTFGHFICFDLMFQVPAVQLPQKMNITDVIFPTMWFSEMPFLTAVEIQEAYAYANDVNFLAAGASNVAVGSAGSGIYSGKAGALISTMPGVDTRRLLVASVPKVPGQLDRAYPGALPNDPAVMDGLLLKRDQSLPSHVTRLLEESEELQEFTLTDGDVSCSFSIQLRALQPDNQTAQTYNYRATAFDGVRSFDGVASGGSRVCSVVACSGPEPHTCSVRFPQYSPHTVRQFERLTVSASVPAPRADPALLTADASYLPTSLAAAILPLPTHAYSYEEATHGDVAVLTLELLDRETELLALGVWGRYFERDGSEPTPPLAGAGVAVHLAGALLWIPLAYLLRALLAG